MNKTVSCSPITAEDRFDPWLVYERFVVNKRHWERFVSELSVYLLSFIPRIFHNDLHLNTVFKGQMGKA